MNKNIIVSMLIAVGLSISLVAPTAVEAQRVPVAAGEMPIVDIAPAPPRVPGEFDEVQHWLDKKDQARFDGIIVNPQGWAYILSEYDALQERSQAAIEAQRNADLAFINLELNKVLAEWEADQQASEVKIAAREDDLRRCQKINKAIVDNKGQMKKKVFLGIGAGAAGVVLGIILQAFVL